MSRPASLIFVPFSVVFDADTGEKFSSDSPVQISREVDFGDPFGPRIGSMQISIGHPIDRFTGDLQSTKHLHGVLLEELDVLLFCFPAVKHDGTLVESWTCFEPMHEKTTFAVERIWSPTP